MRFLIMQYNPPKNDFNSYVNGDSTGIFKILNPVNNVKRVHYTRTITSHATTIFPLVEYVVNFGKLSNIWSHGL